MRSTPTFLFLFLLFTYGYFFQSGQHNENARYDQVRSIVEFGELNIDRFAGNTADSIRVGDHIYPNKVPGLTFISVPVWRIFSYLIPLFVSDHALAIHLVCYFVSLFTVGLMTAMTAVCLWSVSSSVTSSPRIPLLVALSYGIGSIAFPFGTLYFSHQHAAASLFISFTLLYYLTHRERCSQLRIVEALRRSQTLLPLLAGMIAGYSIVVEYPAAIGAGALGLYALTLGWRNAVLFACGGVIGILPLPLYNLSVFGDVLAVTYSAYTTVEESPFPEHKLGFMGVSLPSLNALYQITFGPQRGLFRLSPWMLLAIPSALFAPRTLRRESLIALFICVAFLLFNAAYGTSIIFWGGGSSVGPRHVLPMLPFLSLLLVPILSIRFFRILSYPLLFISILVMVMATATEPRVPYDYSHPISELFWYQYLRGNFALWFGGIFHQAPITAQGVSFNLGSFVGLPGPAELLPLFSVWLISISALRSRVSHREDRMVLSFAQLGIFLFASLPVIYATSDLLNYGPARGLRRELRREAELTVQPNEYEPYPFSSEVQYSGDPQIRFMDTVEAFGGDRVTVEWHGFIRIPEGGGWAFATDSDDESFLYIDGQLVVSNAGIHGPRREVAVRELTPGFHRIAVRYLNHGSGGQMVLHWSKMGHHLHPIPNRFLFLHPVVQ